MTLGTKLNTYIEHNNRKQAEVAVSWLERWSTGGEKKGWATNTITSHLNRLLRDLPQGVRFFFQDRARAALLFQVLDIPESEHPGLFELAERALKTEGAPARVVVDATGWTQGAGQADALFGELKRLLITEGPYPIDLVILDDQYDRLPRSFDDYKEKVRVVRVKSPAEGWERAQELAEEQGLVLSARRFSEFERWLAADFNGGTLRLEPPDGLQVFRAQGRLPTLEPVPHDLAELVPVGTELPPRGLPEGGQLHRLMRALRSEQGTSQLQMDAATRQGLARSLGINATSTHKERMDHAVQALMRELPVKLQVGAADALKEQLVRAERRQVGPLALRVGDAVHLLNVPDAGRFAEGRPWLHVHTIVPQRTALEQVLEAVKDWTEFDFLNDPFLDQVLERLEPREDQRTTFMHARAGLLLSQALNPKAAVPVPDWKAALEELLAGEPPQALLRVQLEGARIQYAGRERQPFAVTETRAKRMAHASPRELHQLPPVGELLLRREEELLVVAGGDVREQRDWRGYEGAVFVPPHVLLPLAPDVARNPEHWLDLYEASRFGTRKAETDSKQRRELPVWRELGPKLLRGELDSWSTGVLEIPEELWEEADRELAMAWLALRMALARPQTVRLHDGVVLLRLGGPFFAELRISSLRNPASPKEVQGSLTLEAEFGELLRYTNGTTKLKCELSGLSDLIPTHTVKGGYDFGAQLPRRIHLLGQRYCADIRFRGSALFAESSSALPHAAAVARIEDEKQEAAAAATAAAAAAADDDDSDDSDDSDDY